jgi:cytochrome c oxidase subunit 4
MAEHAHTIEDNDLEADIHEHHAPGGLMKYLAVFAALLVLTAISFAVGSSQSLRENSPGVMMAMMMAVSCAKAMLVILFFMHLKDHPKLIKVTFGAAFFFFLILVAHTLSDYLSRGGKGMPHFPASGIVSNQ